VGDRLAAGHGPTAVLTANPRSGQNAATRIAATVLGIHAGLLGAARGYFETRQGDIAASSIEVNAIGPPCQPEAVWHACLSAMTVVPNQRVSGGLAMAVSLLALLWAVLVRQRKRGGLVLIGLAIVMLLVGAGFVAPYAALLAGLAADRLAAWVAYGVCWAGFGPGHRLLSWLGL
jgi:hypothetical protein